MRTFVAAEKALVVVMGLALLAGCGREPSARSASSEPATGELNSPSRSAAKGSVEQRRADLLNRIRAADPQQATIVRALVNENNELGLVLSRQANLDDVPKLLRTMLAELDSAFPGQNHTAIAYAPTNPPQPIGTARLDARTRDMTYTPAQPR